VQMINYNLVGFAGSDSSWIGYGAMLMYIVIFVCFMLGNWLSSKLMKPTYPGWGRILYGALLLLCTNIVFSLVFFQMPLLATIFTVVAWYFEVKFLCGYSWGKAIVGWLFPIAIAVIVILILWLIWPSWIVSVLGFKLI